MVSAIMVSMAPAATPLVPTMTISSVRDGYTLNTAAPTAAPNIGFTSASPTACRLHGHGSADSVLELPID